MKKLVEMLKSEQANATVEAVVVFPIVFVAIFTIIVTCLMMHDRAVYEAAAKRGAIYASHIIANPSYKSILTRSGNKSGSLDIDSEVKTFEFTDLGKTDLSQVYRAFKSSTPGLQDDVKTEVTNIIKQTRLNWMNSGEETAKITVKQDNKVFYQDVSVTIKVSYPLPSIVKIIGLDDKYEYTVTAKMAVNDPDEFIRNVDLVIDVIADVDEKFFDGKGQETLSNITSKISGAISKAKEWFDM